MTSRAVSSRNSRVYRPRGIFSIYDTSILSLNKTLVSIFLNLPQFTGFPST
jgi:hypothetical protein